MCSETAAKCHILKVKYTTGVYSLRLGSIIELALAYDRTSGKILNLLESFLSVLFVENLSEPAQVEVGQS